MRKIRFGVIVLCMLLCSATYAPAQVSIGIGLPNVSIGINLPLYPELVPVPGYPVYYAPHVDANYFFYDGMYWVFWDGNWYASYWYNGPWALVDPWVVPVFILRIPVRYYLHPPVFFHGWRRDAPPHWGKHWGHRWEQHRRGWDRWKRGSAPPRAPLPVYQRRYTGDRYPRVDHQRTIHNRYYRYQPRDTIIRRHYRGERAPGPGQPGRREAPPAKSPRQHEMQRSTPPRQSTPAVPRQQQPRRGEKDMRRATPAQPPPQRQGPAYREQRQRPGGEQRDRQERGFQNREQRPQ